MKFIEVNTLKKEKYESWSNATVQKMMVNVNDISRIFPEHISGYSSKDYPVRMKLVTGEAYYIQETYEDLKATIEENTGWKVNTPKKNDRFARI